VTFQYQLWVGAGCAALLAAWSAFADHRRNNRRDLDRVGLVPWPLVLVLAVIASAVLVALALNAG
jgi:hypothetical protein